MKWNTNIIVEDLKKLIGDKAVVETEKHAQGERYCRDIYIGKGLTDGIKISGFNLEDISDSDTPEEEIEQVEVRTFDSDDRGGLPKRSSKEIKELYNIVVDYFNQFTIEVVDTMDDYF